MEATQGHVVKHALNFTGLGFFKFDVVSQGPEWLDLVKINHHRWHLASGAIGFLEVTLMEDQDVEHAAVLGCVILDLRVLLACIRVDGIHVRARMRISDLEITD